MIDNFSEQAEEYARYRPTFPADLIRNLADLTEKDLAWDIAAGNGQVAVVLAGHFKKVIATDLSQQQLDHARKEKNVEYRAETAEKTSLKANSVNLAVVAQGAHWFDFEPFYREVDRVMVKGGILALLGYSLLRTGTELDDVIDRFYHDTLGTHWDPQRKYIEEEYRTIPFPYKEIKVKGGPYSIRLSWGLSDFLGYFSTWSAVRHYLRERNQDPVALVFPELRKHWPSKTDHVEVVFPVFTRIGQVE